MRNRDAVPNICPDADGGAVVHISGWLVDTWVDEAGHINVVIEAEEADATISEVDSDGDNGYWIKIRYTTDLIEKAYLDGEEEDEVA